MSLTQGPTSQVTSQQLLVPQTAEAAPVQTEEVYPVFAKLEDRNLVLPVAASRATIIAYGASSNEAAVPLEPLGSQVNGGVVSRGLERVFSGESTIKYYLLGSEGRSVCKTGTVAVGAAPGTPVMSPVNGTVTGVRAYMLYGKYEDVQIDIRPEGLGDLTVSLLLIEEPVVNIGQTVTAGKTQLGKVRAPQGDIGERLTEFTHDSGSHLHMEVTRDQAAAN
ncbi:MAG: hypothetical protein Kow00129_14300 [Thermoleophilia bacterium]